MSLKRVQKMRHLEKFLIGAVLLFINSLAFGNEGIVSAQQVQINLSTVMLMFASALVLLMQLGFAFLESGVCRTKNTVNIMMKNVVDLGFSVTVFWAIGFAFLYGNNSSGLIGFSNFFLIGIPENDYAIVLFHMLFAATAVTITSGAMAERTKFFGYIVSAIMITGFIYPIAASWVWGGEYGGSGWLANLGFIDFAGSSVVHSVGGWVALMGVLVVGARSGRFDQDGKPVMILGHNISYVAFGGIVLWVGWFGFNGGSIINADVSIGKILLVTHLGAAGGIVGSVLIQFLNKQPVFLVTSINGALGGLVSVTAGAATMDPMFGLLAGLVGGIIVYYGEKLLLKLKIDDVIGAIPVHAFGGVWGTIAAGLFYAEDLFSIERVGIQFIGILAIMLWSILTAYAVYASINAIFGLRVERRSERRGLDFTEHYEIAYPEFVEIQTHKGKS